MPKARRKPKQKKTQHEKLVELAREVGADESKAAFADQLRRIAHPKQKPKNNPKRER